MKDLMLCWCVQDPKTGERGSILDTRDTIDVAALTRNTEVVASALLRHIFNTPVDGICDNGPVSHAGRQIDRQVDMKVVTLVHYTVGAVDICAVRFFLAFN